MSILFFLIFCVCGFCESEKQRHDEKDKEHELQQGAVDDTTLSESSTTERQHVYLFFS